MENIRTVIYICCSWPIYQSGLRKVLFNKDIWLYDDSLIHSVTSVHEISPEHANNCVILYFIPPDIQRLEVLKAIRLKNLSASKFIVFADSCKSIVWLLLRKESIRGAFLLSDDFSEIVSVLKEVSNGGSRLSVNIALCVLKRVIN